MPQATSPAPAVGHTARATAAPDTPRPKVLLRCAPRGQVIRQRCAGARLTGGDNVDCVVSLPRRPAPGSPCREAWVEVDRPEDGGVAAGGEGLGGDAWCVRTKGSVTLHFPQPVSVAHARCLEGEVAFQQHSKTCVEVDVACRPLTGVWANVARGKDLMRALATPAHGKERGGAQKWDKQWESLDEKAQSRYLSQAGHPTDIELELACPPRTVSVRLDDHPLQNRRRARCTFARTCPVEAPDQAPPPPRPIAPASHLKIRAHQLRVGKRKRNEMTGSRCPTLCRSRVPEWLRSMEEYARRREALKQEWAATKKKEKKAATTPAPTAPTQQAVAPMQPVAPS